MRMDRIPKDAMNIPDKKLWLIWQFVKYRNFHKNGVYVKNIFELLVVVNMVAWLKLYAIFPCLVMFLITDYLYDLLTFGLLKPYYEEMGNYLFSGETESLQINVLLNNLGNVLNNKDVSIQGRLDERLKESYDEFMKRREPNDNATQGKVKEKAQGGTEVG